MMLARGTFARLPRVSSHIARSFGGLGRRFQFVRNSVALKGYLFDGAPASNGLSVAEFCSTRCIAQRAKTHLEPEYREYRVDVPLRNNGHVSLDILEPCSKARSLPDDKANVIIHLPPGPALLEDALLSSRQGQKTYSPPDPNPQLSLFKSAQQMEPALVVTINYRLGPSGQQSENGIESPTYTYPLPVHDTLTGFDWIFQHLRPKTVCVHGSHVGGSLALMLALTETRSVHRVAVSEPICDWVSLDEYCAKEKDGKAMRESSEESSEEEGEEEGEEQEERQSEQPTTAPADLVPLLLAREVLFQKTGNYFDAFASPLFFIRTAGKTPPLLMPSYHIGPEYPVPLLKPPVLEEDEYGYLVDPKALENEKDDQSMYDQLYSKWYSKSKKPALASKRPLRWPPFGMDTYWNNPSAILRRRSLTLPDIQFYVTPDPQYGIAPSRQSSVLLDQTLEMVRVMHIACFRANKTEEESQKVRIVDAAGPPMERERPGMTVEQRAGLWFSHVKESLDD